MALEASMVFPALFTALITMVLLGMYVYQNVALYFVTAVSAERTAFRWDNSSRDPVSGIAPTGKYDSLYWRLADDGAIQSLFQFAGVGGGTMVEVGETNKTDAAGSTVETDSAFVALPETKLLQTAGRIPSPYAGAVVYASGIPRKTIEVKLQRPLSVPLLERYGLADPLSSSTAVIVDPVELIRNIDLVRYYTAKWNARTGGTAARANAAEVLNGKLAPAGTAGPAAAGIGDSSSGGGRSVASAAESSGGGG